MLDLTDHMIIWGGLFAHGDGSTGLMKVVFCYALTVSNIPRLTKTLHQSYNDGIVNPEVVCHPSMAKTTVMDANRLPPFWYG
jgi:hypothetical protein